MRFLSLGLFLLLSLTGLAAPKGWVDDLEKARAQAKAEGKSLLLNFTGSDWCAACAQLDKEVFSQAKWESYARQHYVLLELDFPLTHELSPRLKQQNESLRKQFKVEGFPTIIVLNSAGEVLSRRAGYVPGGPDAFIAALRPGR